MPYGRETGYPGRGYSRGEKVVKPPRGHSAVLRDLSKSDHTLQL